MTNINYRNFAFAALKITFFCLVITGLFKLLGVSNNTLLVVFNMAVMSAAATFSVKQKHSSHVALGSSVIVLSILTGGIIGYYIPWLAKLLTILYAGLAFYLTKTPTKTNTFVTGSVMFLIFAALPFNWQDGLQYALDGLVVIAIFIGFHWLFDYKNSIKPKGKLDGEQKRNNQISAITAVLSLTVAWVISYVLSLHFHLSHLYWIALTVLVVIQSSQQKTINTSIKRILINAFGAILIVFLFNYIIPSIFWINFSMLVLFLFLIFFLSFSYIGRTLFIELFVLSFTHLLGDYQNVIALDRVMLTLIGGVIVIVVTPLSYFLGNKKFF